MPNIWQTLSLAQLENQHQEWIVCLMRQSVWSLITHPLCINIALQVYNSALSLFRIFHLLELNHVCLFSLRNRLWIHSRIGDRYLWPIQMLGCSHVYYNSRLTVSASSYIHSHQTSFIRGRFIDDNGLLKKLIMEQARLTNSHSISLLLNQEKAYE